MHALMTMPTTDPIDPIDAQLSFPFGSLFTFGDPASIRRAGVRRRLPERLYLAAARVTVERTPLWTITSTPEPVERAELEDVLGDLIEGVNAYLNDWDELVGETLGERLMDAEHIAYDPTAYAPYTDLVLLDGDYYLVEVQA